MTGIASEHRASSRLQLAGIVRVAAYTVLLGLGLSVWFVYGAYADARRALFQLGEQLTPELGMALAGPAEAVELNGQPLFLGSQQSELTVREVLDRFAAACVGGVTYDAAWATWPASLDAQAAPLVEDPFRFSILRAEDDEHGEGMLACLAQPDRPALATLVGRVERFMASGDLSALGELRYVTAKRRANGKTHVIGVWTRGAFKPGALFPESGDAPGSDMADVPRPPDAQRDLTASTPGRSHALRVYDSRRSSGEVVQFYERALPRLGWEALPLSNDMQPGAGIALRAFTRRGRALAITAQSGSRAATSVSLIDMGSIATSPDRAE